MDENLETFSLLWLNTSANSFEENHQAYKQLRSAINYIRTFEDVESCEKYVRHSSDDRIVLIISGQSGRKIVSHIQDLQHVRAIYVYCDDRSEHDTCINQSPKVGSFQQTV
jgi:hypothetical protein